MRLVSRAAGTYNPQRSDFPLQALQVLVWMAEKMISLNSINDATARWKDFLRFMVMRGESFYLMRIIFLGRRKKRKRFSIAAVYYDSALTNSSWHPNSDDARMRRGMAFFEVGKSTKSQTDFEKASSSFEEIRGNTEASLDRRAESSFMMGECRKNLKDYAGAAFFVFGDNIEFPECIKMGSKII